MSIYSYKEAALNPTNPRNRAVEWEADIVNAFRNNPDRGEISGMRETPTGRSLYLARPFQIKDKACLACHTTAAMAPPAMVKIYGTGNGFGWKHMEVIGAQIVSVPMALPIENANRAFYTFMISLSVVFVVLFIILNLMMSLLIVRPITRMSEAAESFQWGLQRFLDEARTLASFRHPNIVRVMRFFEANRTGYMVMEFVEGKPLSEWMAARRPLPQQSLQDLAGPLLDGLEIIHNAGYLHRDIKPANIFMRQDGSAVLIDFGSARELKGGNRELTAIVSPGYAPLDFLATVDWALKPDEDERPQSVAEFRRRLLGAARFAVVDRTIPASAAEPTVIVKPAERKNFIRKAVSVSGRS